MVLSRLLQSSEKASQLLSSAKYFENIGKFPTPEMQSTPNCWNGNYAGSIVCEVNPNVNLKS